MQVKMVLTGGRCVPGGQVSEMRRRPQTVASRGPKRVFRGGANGERRTPDAEGVEFEASEGPRIETRRRPGGEKWGGGIALPILVRIDTHTLDTCASMGRLLYVAVVVSHWNVVDPKIGAWLLDPDHPPVTFQQTARRWMNAEPHVSALHIHTLIGAEFSFFFRGQSMNSLPFLPPLLSPPFRIITR